MRKAIVIALVAFGVLLLAAVPTSANPVEWPPVGNIIPYADIEGTSQIIKTPLGTVRIYLILAWMPLYSPATACQFSAPKPSCLDAVLVEETHYFYTTIGDSQTGMGVSFVECRIPPVVLARLTYEAVGSTTCCFYWVLPDPHSPRGRIDLVDCADRLYAGTGGALIFNPNESNCTGYSPIETSTWGKVKSLYAQ